MSPYNVLMTNVADESNELIRKALAGSDQALAELFDQNRKRLSRLLTLRMDPRIRARVSSSDVLQETFIELARRLPKYSQDAKIPFFIWLRTIAGNCLARAHRTHLGAEMRDAARDVSLAGAQVPGVSTILLASHIAGQFTSVDRDMLRAELQLKLQETLNGMSAEDREILALRHFEELTTDECSHVLKMTRSGVLKRHTRALRRLRDSIADQTDFKPFES